MIKMFIIPKTKKGGRSWHHDTPFTKIHVTCPKP